MLNNFRLKYWMFFLLLLFIICSYTASAQRYLIHNYTEESGLPSSTVFCMTQDASGKLWFGTRNGIAVYDGSQWIYYTTQNGLTYNQVMSLQIDKYGKVWALTKSQYFAINYFDGHKWKRMNFDYNLPDYYDQRSAVFEVNYSNDDLLIAFGHIEKGVVIYYHNKWQRFTSQNGLPGDKVFSIKIDSNKVWIGTDKGLCAFINGKIYIPDYLKPCKNLRIFGINVEKFTNNTSKLWIVTDSYISSLANNHLTIYNFKIDIPKDFDKYTYSLEPNYFNMVVFSSPFYNFLFNKTSHKITLINKNSGLIDNGCFFSFKDRENILWFCGVRGVSKIASMRFANFSSTDGLCEDEVTSILETQDHRYIFGHNNSITIKKDNTYIKIPFSKQINYFSRVLSIIEDRHGNIWIASQKRGIGKLLPNNTIKWYSIESMKILEILAMTMDADGNIIFSDGDYLYLFDNGKAIPYHKEEIKKFEYSFQRNLYIGKSGKIYIGTVHRGVLIKDRNTWYRITSSNPMANNIFSIYETKSGLVLVGSKAGLYYKKDNALYKFKAPNLEISRPVYFIVQDKLEPNVFWFGTDAGIIRWDGRYSRSYGVREGLAGLETNRNAGYIDSKGTLWIGTNKGLSRYDKDLESSAPIKPLVELSALDVLGSIYNLNYPISLASNENDLVFHFNAISFFDEDKNTYSYMLEGVDKNWIEDINAKTKFVRYTNLPPGNYKFKIRCTNALGITSDIVYSAKIVIALPFYLKWWFILFISIISLFILRFIINYRTDIKYRTVLEKEVKIRTQQYANSEKRYRQMFEDNNAIMLLIDPLTGRIVDANPSAVTFYQWNKTELLRKRIIELDPRFIPDNHDNDQRLLKELRETSDLETIHYIADGTTKDVQFYSSLLDNENVIYIIIDDITQRKLADAQVKKLNEGLEQRVNDRTKELRETLEKLNAEIEIRKNAETKLLQAKADLEAALSKEKELGEMKSSFISMISHEYRTPLTVIQTSSELVRQFIRKGNQEKAENYISKIFESIKVMINLIDNVLSIGKSEKGKLRFAPEEFDIIPLLNNIVEEVSMIDKNKHKIAFDNPFTEKLLFSDPNLIRQICTNLLVNACKFSPESDSIDFKLSEEGNNLVIKVADKGFGMTEDEVAHLFEPFFRSRQSIGVIPGTGLGLSIVKKCIDAIGGNISVESEYGFGTTFIVKIPYPQED